MNPQDKHQFANQIDEKQIQRLTQQNNQNFNPNSDSTKGNQVTKADPKRQYFDQKLKKTTAEDIQQLLKQINTKTQINLNGTESQVQLRQLFRIQPLFSKLKVINVYTKEENKKQKIMDASIDNQKVRDKLKFHNEFNQSSIKNEKIYKDIQQLIKKLKQNIILGKADYRRFKYIDVLIILSANLPQIQTLWICGCQIKDDSIIPQYLNSYYHTLKHLDISANYIGIKFIKSLNPEFLNRLHLIKLAWMKNINDQCIQYLSQHLKKCQNIDIGYTSITSYGINKINKNCFEKLKILNIWSGHEHPNRYYQHSQFSINKNIRSQHEIEFSKTNFQEISKFKLTALCMNTYFQNISEIILSLSQETEYIEIGGPLSEQVIQHIEKMPKLKRIYLIHTSSRIPKLISQQIVSYMIKVDKQKDFNYLDDVGFQKLRSFRILNQYIDDSLLQKLFAKIKNKNPPFQSADLSNIQTQNQKSIQKKQSGITIQGIIYLCNFKNIIWLNLQNHKSIGNYGVYLLFKHLNKLKTLKISKCNISLIEIDDQNQAFYSLVAENNQLDDRSVDTIVNKLPNIRNLELTTNKITSNGLKNFLKNLNHLEKLQTSKIIIQTDLQLKQLHKKMMQKIEPNDKSN